MRRNQSESRTEGSATCRQVKRIRTRWLRLAATGAFAGLVIAGAWIQRFGDDSAETLTLAPLWGQDFASTHWPKVDDTQAGAWRECLADLPRLVGGSGFIARDGKAVFRWGNDHHSHYIASAMKPFLSALLLLAVEQGLVSGLDAPVADVVPELRNLGGGSDSLITWRQLATMTSGYGVEEAPGEAFAYNDFAVQLFYDALIHGVFASCGDEVLLRHLAGPLGFEDWVTFRGFGDGGPEPKMRASARDLAKFGQWLLDGRIVGAGADHDKLPGSIRDRLTSMAVDESVPMTSAIPAPMLPGQGTVGGGKPNLFPMGPGRYGYHLWHNRTSENATRKIPPAPEDSILAVGKLGESVLWIIPSWQMVVAWTNSDVDGQAVAAEDPEADFNEVARLLARAIESR